MSISSEWSLSSENTVDQHQALIELLDEDNECRGYDDYYASKFEYLLDHLDEEFPMLKLISTEVEALCKSDHEESGSPLYAKSQLIHKVRLAIEHWKILHHSLCDVTMECHAIRNARVEVDRKRRIVDESYKFYRKLKKAKYNGQGDITHKNNYEQNERAFRLAGYDENGNELII
jgi:hypothetical protein